MSINYIIIIVHGNIDMIAKYMPNLKKVSRFGYASLSKSVIFLRVFGDGFAPKRFLTPFKSQGVRSCFLLLLIQTQFILMHYIAYDQALFINGKGSVAESHTEDRKYLCRFHPCNEILMRLYEIFEKSKKQDLTPL